MKKSILTTLTAFVMVLFLSHIAVAEEEKTFSLLSATENITLSGAAEVEAGTSSDFDGVDSSDIVLATVELGVDAQISEWCSGHILLLWEEDDTEPLDVDEGYITIGGNDKYPVYLRGGKMYVPFGTYESNMISDPLTLEIGETRESAIQIGTDYKGFYGSIYAFNGDIQKQRDNDEDTIKAYGANAGYAFANDKFDIDFGADYTSNILDSDGLGDRLEEMQSEFIDVNPDGSYGLNDTISGLGAHVILGIGPVSLIGEYIGALGDQEYNTDDGIGTATDVK